MKKDIQKPILYKADPYVFAQLEKIKEERPTSFNRNKFLNDALLLYIELYRLMQSPEFFYFNEVNFGTYHLQRVLYERLRKINREIQERKYIQNTKGTE